MPLKKIYNKIFSRSERVKLLKLNYDKKIGSTSIIYIVGPPAVGKTTFISFLLDEGQVSKTQIQKRGFKISALFN